MFKIFDLITSYLELPVPDLNDCTSKLHTSGIRSIGHFSPVNFAVERKDHEVRRVRKREKKRQSVQKTMFNHANECQVLERE